MPIQIGPDLELSTDEVDLERAAKYHVTKLPWAKLRGVLDYFASMRHMEFHPPHQHDKMRSRTLTSIADDLELYRREVINACAYWGLSTDAARRADEERPTKSERHKITKKQVASLDPWKAAWKMHGNR